MRLYSTLTRRKEEFRPLEPGRVRVYSCGPTVYRYAHVGNLRTYLFADVLCRVLEYLGHDVTQVMNITDVGHLTDDQFDRGEDKMLLSARLENKSAEEIAEYYTRAFLDDARKLNVRRAEQYPRATEYVPRMQELIARLIERGHAYEVDGTVYYDIASFPEYGKLSRNSTEQLLAGSRGEPDPRKRHPGDFTLWKAATGKRLQVWDSPWGPGFPGWHIECSAMSTALLGERFDIHTGGSDNVFPHHEAEIAQSEGVFGHPVVNYWMHGEHLLLSGARMAKSAGNFFRVTELEEQGYDPLAFRYLALQARYRTKLNFSVEGLAGADRALRQLRARVAEWRDGPAGPDGPRGEYTDRFRAAISNDLDLPTVMALVSEVVRSDLAPGARAALLLDWDRVLGLDLGRPAPLEEEVAATLPEGADELLAQRERARTARDYATSDRLRDQLAGMGVRVIDTREGQRWEVTAGTA
ncbi:MAG TPA: cysteine--tRNA ligase [Candidatus Dormibacteraeota bacterium]|nr:cysteine--tRNA ligase [Candidatus Dormibacteraeota bacterium]